MKILRVINSLHIGGAERSVVGNVPYHLKNGFDIDVLLLNGTKTFFLEELKNSGVKIKTLGKNNIYNPLLIFKIAKFINHYDVVHVSLFPSLYWVAFAKIITRSKTKLIYTEHSTFNKRRNKIIYKIIDKFIYKRYNKIIAISPEAKTNLIKHIGKNHNVSVIYNGVDIDRVKREMKTEMFFEYKNEWKGKTIITQIAGFRQSKDQDTLIRTLQSLPIKFHCVFVGDGERIIECKRLVNKLGLDNRVTFLGKQKSIGAVLRKTDIVVMSSHWEGFGRAAIEGMAAKKPVIGTNVSGLSEVLKNNGLLFNVGDEEKLSRLILKLDEDEEFYNQIAVKCLQRANDFDIKKMISSYEVEYNTL